MNTSYLRSLAAGFLFCTVSACDKPAASSPTPPVATVKPRAAPVILQGKAREQLEAQARAWADLINQKKSSEVVRNFDLPRLFKTIVDDIECEDDFRRGLLSGLTKSGKELTTTITKQWNGGEARFQKVEDTTQGTVARLRIVMDDGTSYLDLIPEVTKDGKVTILDIDNRSMGVRISDTVKQIIVALINSMPKQAGLLTKLFGGSESTTEDNKNLQEYFKASQQNKPRACELYSKLPLSIRRNRAFYATYLQLATSLDDEKVYLTAMGEGKKQFPNDASIQFMLVDYHFLRKEYDEVEKCMATTIKELGEDGNLWMLNAVMRMTAGKLDAADEAYHNSIRLEPDILNHHSVGFQIAAQRKDYPEVVRRLQVASKALGEPIALVASENEALNAARESSEYKEYAANLKLK
jgi:hypothetical protein